MNLQKEDIAIIDFEYIIDSLEEKYYDETFNQSLEIDRASKEEKDQVLLHETYLALAQIYKGQDNYQEAHNAVDQARLWAFNDKNKLNAQITKSQLSGDMWRKAHLAYMKSNHLLKAFDEDEEYFFAMEYDNLEGLYLEKKYREQQTIILLETLGDLAYLRAHSSDIILAELEIDQEGEEGANPQNIYRNIDRSDLRNLLFKPEKVSRYNTLPDVVIKEVKKKINQCFLESLNYYKKQLLISPTNLSVHLKKAVIEIRMNRFNEAVTSLQYAAKWHPGSSKIELLNSCLGSEGIGDNPTFKSNNAYLDLRFKLFGI